MQSNVGVFVGIMSTEFRDALQQSNAFGMTGTGHCFAAGRISYVLGLHGPCASLDSACSSALVAVDTALRDARAGRIDYAVVGGVNLIASSAKAAEMFAHLRRASMLVVEG